MTILISPAYTGVTANDGTGDTVRDAFTKVNNSLANLKVGFDGIYSTYANTTYGSFTDLEITGNVTSSMRFYGSDTVLINGSPVVTAAVAFPGGPIPGAVDIQANTASNDVTTGALVVRGGLGVVGNINIGGELNVLSDGENGGNLIVNSTQDSGSTDTGALVVKGGLGVARTAYFGSQIFVNDVANFNNDVGILGATTISSNTASINTATGALLVSGGVGVAGAINAGQTSSFGNDMYVGGNLYVTGSTVSGGQNLSIQDNIIDLHTFANLAPLTLDDGLDVGIKYHVYKPGYGDYEAWSGWANNTGYYEFYDRGQEVGGNFVGDTYGTFKGGGFISVNTTPSISTTTGAVTTAGGVGVAGNVNIGGNISAAAFFFANGQPFISNTYGNANVAAYLATGTTTGNVTTGNLTVAGNIYGNTVGTTATVTGTVSLGNVLLLSGLYWANGVSYSSTIVSGVSSVYGTSNQITANVNTGAIGLSLPQNIHTAATPTFAGLNVSGEILPTANASINIGSSSSWFGTFYGVSTQAKYADLAENYISDSDYQPGTVVIFGGEKEITITSKIADVSVAGVISTNPAYLMNSDSPGLPVALRGRVPVRVQGKVKKGDLLITGSIPGVAMSAGVDPSYGIAVFAKSLEDKDLIDVGIIEAVII